MKPLKIIFLIMIFTALFDGCTPMAEQVMPPLQYQSPIHVHVNKTAYINWKIGKQSSSEQPTFVPANSGLVGAMLANAIDSTERKNNPGRYTFTYGKAQQAVFVTSLKDILAEQHVFKKVELTVDPKTISPDDVLIIIFFKSTRVSDASQRYKITLDVELLIQTKGQLPFKRTYFVESSSGGIFSMKSFKDQQAEVSNMLLEKIIAGIKEWAKP